MCKLCNHRFGNNLGLECRHTPPLFITLSLVLNGAGMPPFNIQIMLEHLNVKVHVDTISGWLEHYAELVEKYTDSMQPPNLGRRPGADEKRQDVKGKENYYVLAMDLATRFILAWETTTDKMSHDVTKLLEAAKAKAGKPHITDGLSGYHTAFKKVFGVLNACSCTCATSTYGTGSPTPTSRRGSTARSPAEPARGINSKNSPACRIFILLHPPARRNRRQDTGRGSRHQNTGP